MECWRCDRETPVKKTVCVTVIRNDLTNKRLERHSQWVHDEYYCPVCNTWTVDHCRDEKEVI